MLGGSVVGMTVGAEATLARERGLCYAALCIVTNSALQANAHEIREAARAGADRATEHVFHAALGVRENRECGCRAAPAAGRL